MKVNYGKRRKNAEKEGGGERHCRFCTTVQDLKAETKEEGRVNSNDAHMEKKG